MCLRFMTRLLELVGYIGSKLAMTKYNYCSCLYITISNQIVHYYIDTCLPCTIEGSELIHELSRHCLSWYFWPVCDVCDYLRPICDYVSDVSDNSRPVSDHISDQKSQTWSQIVANISNTCTFHVASSSSRIPHCSLLRVMTGNRIRETNRKAKDDRYYQK